MRKMIKTAGLVSICVLFILIFFGHKIIERIIFRPTELEPSVVFKFDKPFEEFFIITEPEVNINIIKFPVKNPKGSILYFHGNKDNLMRWGEIASQFSAYDFDVYVFDYRGYGKSTGAPSESGILKDSEIIFEKINKKYPDQHWIFYGRSLGTGVAAYLSSKYNPKGLILEAPYFSMVDLIAHYYFPYAWYRHKVSFDSYRYLKESSFPVLILHGTNDRVVPIEEGQKLFKTLQNPKKRMVIIKHGTHDNLSGFYEYQKTMQNFLNEECDPLGKSGF